MEKIALMKANADKIKAAKEEEQAALSKPAKDGEEQHQN